MPAAGLLRRTKPGKVWRQESRFMKKRATVILFLLVCILLSVSTQAAEAEQDTAWSVSALQKTGSDEENMVFLIFAEGYTQAQQEQFWEDARVRFAGMLQYEPYRSYAGRINAYAVFAPSNEAGVSDKYGDTVDTYFGVVAIGKTLKFREQFYLDRVSAIRSYMEETILDGSASVTTMHFLINTTASVGSSSGVMYSFSALGEDTADGTLTFRVTGGSGRAAVIAAQYTNGRMVECRTAQTELPMQDRLVMSFAALPGAEYQIFILDGKTFEPLCARTNAKEY